MIPKVPHDAHLHLTIEHLLRGAETLPPNPIALFRAVEREITRSHRFMLGMSDPEARFKPNQIVIFHVDGPEMAKLVAEGVYPFKDGEHLFFIGEIVQMPGHCAVANKTGKVLWGYHTNNFREPTEDEL